MRGLQVVAPIAQAHARILLAALTGGSSEIAFLARDLYALYNAINAVMPILNAAYTTYRYYTKLEGVITRLAALQAQVAAYIAQGIREIPSESLQRALTETHFVAVLAADDDGEL